MTLLMPVQITGIMGRSRPKKGPRGDQTLAMGTMAGKIWNLLDQNGRMSISSLVRCLEVPRDYVMEGIGWLAREGKIEVIEESHIRWVSLKTDLNVKIV